MKTIAKRVWGAVLVLGLVGAMGLPAWGQGGGFNIDPTVIRQRLLGNIQTQVGFTDEEWSVVEPKLWKIVGLQAETGTGAIGGLAGQARGLGGGRGGRGGFQVNTLLSQIFNNGQPSQVTTKMTELQAVLDRDDSTPMEIKNKLEEYRAAVAKSKCNWMPRAKT